MFTQPFATDQAAEIMDDLVKAILLVTLASLMAACSALPNRSGEDWQGAGTSVRVMEYLVQPGDSLAGISRTLTGDIEHWGLLADFNNIADPSLIQVGDIVLVPAELLPRDKRTLATSTTPTRPTTRSVARPVTSPIKPVSEITPANVVEDVVKAPATVARKTSNETVFQRSALPGAQLVAVTTRPVNVNRTFALSRTSQSAALTMVNGAALVQVADSGDAKSVFAQPFNHSPLLMRAQPGATFTLDQQLGEWLRINTDKGAGYIRRRDAKVIGAS